MEHYSEDAIKAVLKGILEELSEETRTKVEDEINAAGFSLWEKHHVKKLMFLTPEYLEEHKLVLASPLKMHNLMCNVRDNCDC